VSNLALLLADAARRYAARPALLHEGEPIVYAELEAHATRMAGLLRSRGVGPGDRVGIWLPNVPSFVAAFFGALRLGAIVVPLNALLKPGEVSQRLEHSGARELVAAAPVGDVAWVDPEGVRAAEPVTEVVDRDRDDTAVILYTSGTTGDPRGAELTHAGLRAEAEFLVEPLLRLRPEDVVFGAAPLAHIMGLTGVMNGPIAGGACAALTSRFEAAAALELMVSTRTTVFLGVPTMCIALLEAAQSAAALPPLRVAHVGGASLAPDTLRAFAARFGCDVVEGLGMTETGGPLCTHRLGQLCKPGSVGTPVDGMELRVGDESGVDVPQGEVGEVLVRGTGLMKGYWRNPEATSDAFREGGWFATGDMGYQDEDGYLFLVDRKKDIVLRGGYTVYPRELEDVLYAHPGVLEGVVLGVPDEKLGEEVVAVVVPKPGSDLEPEEVREFVRERVAAYKYPRLVVVADELPHSRTGKILRREIDREPLRKALDERAR
jgi:long-chain acyl-CoA synthetase